MAKKAKKKVPTKKAPKPAKAKTQSAANSKASAKGRTKAKATRRKTKPKATKPAKAPTRPARPTEKSYRTLVLARLEELRPALVADLRDRVFVYPFPEGTKSLDYEIHWHTLNGALPVTGYLMDGNRGQVMLNSAGGERVLADNIEVLPSVKPVIPWSVIEPFDDAAVEMLAVHSPLLRQWFVDAWTAAGGKDRFHLPASIAFHDGDDPTPLPTAAG